MLTYRIVVITAIWLLSLVKIANAQVMFEETKGYVAIECEDTPSSLGLWKKVSSEADPAYIANASGGAHLEFTGNSPSGGSANSPLKYTFKINTPGTYHLILRCSKRLLDGETSDWANDCYVKMEGDFTSPYSGTNEPTTNDLKGNIKFFGGNKHPNLGWAVNLDYLNHYKVKPRYVFKSGETYTLTFSGRSQRFNIDYFVLYNESRYTENVAQNTLVPYDSPPIPPDSCHTMNVNDWNREIQGFAPAYVDVARVALAINVNQYPDQWAKAIGTFKGEAGVYDLVFTSLLETRGESSYQVAVDGTQILSFTNPRIHGTEIEDFTEYIAGVRGVSMQENSLLEVEFISHSNGLVPEGDGFGYARGRWRTIRFSCDTGLVETWFEVSGLQETGINPGSAYPNPFRDYLFINDSHHISVRSIRITDMAGRHYDVKQMNDGANLMLDTRNLLPGMYVLQVISENGVYHITVIKN